MVSIGQVHLTSVEIDPQEARPGALVEATARITETAEFVGPFGQLRLCDPSGFNPTGLEVTVVVTPSWTYPREATICLPVSNIGSGEAQVDFEFTAPSGEGSYSIDGHLESTKSDTKSDTKRSTFEVSTSRSARDEPEEDDDEDGGGSGTSDLFNTVVEHPVKSGMVLIGGSIALRSALEGD